MRAQLSGDDAGLKNIWEEFCVQVQGEESFFWEAYVEHVEHALATALRGVRRLERTAIWLQTDEGRDWLSGDSEEGLAPPVFHSDSVKWLYSLIWSQADGDRHARVRAYLMRRAYD